MNTTIVTAYYDLSGNKKEYLETGRRLMRLEHPLIIYTGDQESSDYILNMRKEYNLLDKTIVYIIPFTDLYFFKYKEQINKNREIYWPTKDERCKTDIHILMLSRFYFMKKSIQENKFNTEYFSWMDFNILTKAPNKSTNYTSDKVYNKLNTIFNCPRPKFTITIIGYWNPDDYNDLKLFYSNYKYICTGLFYTTEREIGFTIMDKVIEYAEYITQQGYGHGDEHILGHIIDQNIDSFTLTLGDYQDAIDNYYNITTNIYYIKQVLDEYESQNKLRFEKLLKDNNLFFF